MSEISASPTRAFAVVIAFLSGDQLFACEQYDVEACDDDEAIRIGLDRARESIYHDSRIPDLGTHAYLLFDDEPDDPDPPSP